MKTIYLVSYYFAPLGRADGVNRTYLVKYLSEFGWNMHVITGIEYRSLVLNFQRDPSLLEILPRSVKIHRFESHHGWLVYDFKKVLGARNNLRSYWIRDVEQNFQPQEEGIFMAVVPPVDNAFLAYNLSRKYNTPLALYYPDDVLDAPAHIVEHAKVIFCVTPQIKESLERNYHHQNIVVVEHGSPEPLEYQATDRKCVGYPIKMVYAGSFNFRTRPEIVGQAYRQLMRKDPSVAQKLCIDLYGPQGYYLWFFLRRYLNDHVCYKGYLPFRKLMCLLSGYDIALTVNHADVAFPSKVFHYLNAGLPIFAVTDHPELVKFVQKYGIGLVGSPDVDQLVIQLTRLISEKDRILGWRNNVLNIRKEFLLRNCLKRIDDSLKEIP